MKKNECIELLQISKAIKLVLFLGFVFTLPCEARDLEKEQFLNALFYGRNYPVCLTQSQTYPWKVSGSSVITTSRQDDIASNCWFSLDVYVPEDSASVSFGYRVRYHKETYGWAKYATLTCTIDGEEVFSNNGNDAVETATIKIGKGFHQLKWNLRLGDAWENWDYFASISNMHFEGISDEKALPEFSKPLSNMWCFPLETSSDTIYIENLGQEDYKINMLEGLNAPFYIKSAPSSIAYGKSGAIIIGYDPQEEGCHEQALTIMSNIGKNKIEYKGMSYETEPVCNLGIGKLSEVVKDYNVESLTIFGPMNQTDNYTLNKFKNLKYLDLRGTDMEYIFNGGINNLYNLEDILLPSSLKYIDATWFWKHWDRDKGDLYYNIKTITCLSPEPPKLIYMHGGSEEYYFDGLRSDVIVYVPIQYLSYYEADSKWNKFNIMPLTNDSKALRVKIDTSAISELAGCSIELLDKQMQRTQRLTIGSASEYAFHNLKQGRFYSLSLLHPSKQQLAFNDNIEIGESNETTIQFDSIVPLYRVSCDILGDDGYDITDRVQISWDMPYGNNKTGKEISQLLEGDTVKCIISLPKEISLKYAIPDTVLHIVNQANNNVSIYLTSHNRYIVEGKVVDNTNTPIQSATVTISQVLNGNYSWNKTLKTDAEGRFEIEAYEGLITIDASADRYFSVQHTDTITSSTNAGELMLLPCSGRKISLDVTFKENSIAGKEGYISKGYDEWKEIDFSVIDLDTGEAVKNIKVEYPHIYILDELTGKPSLKVSATSRKKAFNDIEVMCNNLADGNFSAEMQIVEFGNVKATYRSTDCENVTGIIYDEDNNLIQSGTFVNSNIVFKCIPDGNYHLVAIESKDLHNVFSNYSDFEKLGFVDGVNYASMLVSVESGLISEVNIDFVPALSEQQKIAGTKTSILPNKNTVVAGNYFTVKADINIAPEFIGKCEDISLNVLLPEYCTLVSNSLLIGSDLAAFNYEDRIIEIPISEDTEPVRFCVLPIKGGIANVNAYLSYKLDGKLTTEPIGGFSVDVTGVSLDVMPSVPSHSIHIGGTGIANSEVDIMDDDALVGKTTVLADGNWQTTIDLCDERELKTHSLYSRLTTPDGDILFSETKYVRVNSHKPYLSKVEMITNGNMIVFDFMNPPAKKRSYSYNPSYPNFTFKVYFENVKTPSDLNDAILWVRTTDGKDVPIQLITSPSDSTVMLCSRSFTSSSLPTNVAVDMNYIDYSVLMPENALDVIDQSMPTADITDIVKGDNGAIAYRLVFNHGDFALLCGGIEYGIDDDIVSTIDNIVARYEFSTLQGSDNFLISPSNGVLYKEKKDNGKTSVFFLYDIQAQDEYNSVMSMLDKEFARKIPKRVQVNEDGYLVPNPRGLSRRIDQNMQNLIDLCNKKLDCVEKNGEPDRTYAAEDLKATLNNLTGMNLAMVAAILTGTNEIASNVPNGQNALVNGYNIGNTLKEGPNFPKAVEGISNAARKAIENLNRYPSECGLPSNPKYSEVNGVTALIDPSGYVYEAVKSNRLEGVIVTAYYKEIKTDEKGNTNEDISIWDASMYEQENPLYTDAEGRYSWDVPMGLWQVKYEKEGYEPAASEWLPVPPPQMDVNIGMKQLVNPNVTHAIAYSDSICFVFSKYMDARLLTLENIEVKQDGATIEGKIELSDGETEEGRIYASRVRFIPIQPLEANSAIELSIKSKVKSYAGCPILCDYIETLAIQQPVKIEMEETLEMNMGETIPIKITVNPAKSAIGNKLALNIDSEYIVSIDNSEFEIVDGTQEIVVNVSGLLPGNGVLTAKIDNLGASTKSEIQVNNNLMRQTYAPWATIESGNKILPGTILYLFSATPDAAIYYTTDGSCPCDETSRMLYNSEDGIIIDGEMTIRAYAIAEGMFQSEIIELCYFVENASGLEENVEDYIFVPTFLSNGNDEIMVLFGEHSKSALVEIFDIHGNRIIKKKVNSGETISLMTLWDEVYIISINLSGKRVARKFVKTH